ncbi:MAG: cysteine desulfurase family protein [Clostridia bacterium]
MKAYLDNSATTQPSEEVISAMGECMRHQYYNPSSLYAPAIESERAMDACRDLICQALRAPDGRVLFTSGGTESNNLAILGAVSAMRPSQHVIATSVEHPSVLAACAALESAGHRVTYLPVDGRGQLNWDALDRALLDAPGLVSCMQVNNETGAMPDIARLRCLLHEKAPGALLHVDGVQGFLRVPFDAHLCDLYTLSGHKLNGPKGIGALWLRKGVRLLPRQMGGGQQGAERSGTENTPGIAGLRAAIAGMPEDAPATLRFLKNRLIAGLKAQVPELRVNGPAPEDAAPHIVNIGFPGVRGEVMLHALEGEGVYVSTGSACSSKKRKLSPVLLAMGLSPDQAECAVRFSLCPTTTHEEIDYACAVAGAQYQILKRFRRK